MFRYSLNYFFVAVNITEGEPPFDINVLEPTVDNNPPPIEKRKTQDGYKPKRLSIYNPFPRGSYYKELYLILSTPKVFHYAQQHPKRRPTLSAFSNMQEQLMWKPEKKKKAIINIIA